MKDPNTSTFSCIKINVNGWYLRTTRRRKSLSSCSHSTDCSVPGRKQYKKLNGVWWTVETSVTEEHRSAPFSGYLPQSLPREDVASYLNIYCLKWIEDEWYRCWPRWQYWRDNHWYSGTSMIHAVVSWGKAHQTLCLWHTGGENWSFAIAASRKRHIGQASTMCAQRSG